MRMGESTYSIQAGAMKEGIIWKELVNHKVLKEAGAAWNE